MTATAMALFYGAGAAKRARDGGGGRRVRHSGGGRVRLGRVLLLLLLVCCSPVLVPLLLLASPLILLLCFAAACLRRPSQGLTREDLAPPAMSGGAAAVSAEHRGDGRALLQRYLEDQLGLALLAFGEEIRSG